MENLDKKFEKLQRIVMTESEFWDWVSLWKDPATIIGDTELWDNHRKEMEIKNMVATINEHRNTRKDLEELV